MEYTFLHTKGVQITVEATDCDTARKLAQDIAKDCGLQYPEDLSVIEVVA